MAADYMAYADSILALERQAKTQEYNGERQQARESWQAIVRDAEAALALHEMKWFRDKLVMAQGKLAE